MIGNRRFIRKGFTLAELLIVIVIIGILAALAVPRFALQRDKAGTTEAIGIMTTIHRALLQYYDERNSYPTLANDAAVKSTLAIDYQSPRLPWAFQTSSAGLVTGTISGTNAGTLTLSAAGAWSGTLKYDPSTGPLWPDLPT